MKTRICLACKKEFSIPWESYHAKHCSIICAWKTKHNNKIYNKYKNCSVSGCEKKIYAKNLCHNHYERLRRSGYVEGTYGHNREERKCEICGKKYICSKNKKQNLCGDKKCGRKKASITHIGINNCRWNNGSSYYPNHILFKKIRLIKLNSVNWKCEKCGGKATEAHHIDGSKTNHTLENLLSLCRKCHCEIHSGRKNKKSKFINIFGKTMADMAIELKLGEATLYQQYKRKGEIWLKNRLAQNVDQNKSLLTKMGNVDAESAERSGRNEPRMYKHNNADHSSRK